MPCSQLILLLLPVLLESASIPTTIGSEGSAGVEGYQNCLKLQTWYNGETNRPPQYLDVLPGLGFDGLHYKDMGQVHIYNYSRCKVAVGGRFVIPDNTHLSPIQTSHYRINTEVFDHWENYTSLTSSGVKFGSDKHSKLSGSFSYEKLSVKENQVNFNAKTTRVVFRNRLFAVSLDPSAKLHPTFRDRIYEIAASIQNEDVDMATYLSELLIRDYGTHYTTSVEAGALMAQLQYISENYANQMQAKNLTNLAELSFPIFTLFSNSTFDFKITHSNNQTQYDSYKHHIEANDIFTVGGAPLTPELEVKNWLEDIPNKLGVIDRTADLLHFAVTPANFPELTPLTALNVSKYIKNATDMYFEINSKRGCLDYKARNFDFQANIRDDTTCHSDMSLDNNYFGGTYQTCSKDRKSRENLCEDMHLSKKHTCPDGYKKIKLHSGKVTKAIPYSKTKKRCTLYFFWCSDVTYTETLVSSAYYSVYWCVKSSESSQSSQYLFGGYFSSTTSNPFTGEQSCPPYFQEENIGVNNKICTSTNYSDLASPYAIKFGGFYSCSAGNPLANIPQSLLAKDKTLWPHGCAPGYSQHLVTVDSGCEISICLEQGLFDKGHVLPPVLPPFHQQPSYLPYWSGDRLGILGAENIYFLRETNGQWQSYSKDSADIKILLEKVRENTNSDNVMPEESDITDTSNDFRTTDAIPEHGNIAGVSRNANAALVLVILVIITIALCIPAIILYCYKKN